jgi:hypothetical protein
VSIGLRQGAGDRGGEEQQHDDDDEGVQQRIALREESDKWWSGEERAVAFVSGPIKVSEELASVIDGSDGADCSHHRR